MTDSGAERRCIACRCTTEKRAMLRLVVDDEGQIWPDLLHKLDGRGAYLCMQPDCFGGLSDKRLQPMKAKFTVAWPQWQQLKERLVTILEKQTWQMFSRLRVKIEIGRDAVMHRLWNNAPLLLFLAADAGDALIRQVEDGVEKRNRAGHTTVVVRVNSKQWLGEMLGPQQVAVAAMDASGVMAGHAEKLERYCRWYGQLKAIG